MDPLLVPFQVTFLLTFVLALLTIKPVDVFHVRVHSHDVRPQNPLPFSLVGALLTLVPLNRSPCVLRHYVILQMRLLPPFIRTPVTLKPPEILFISVSSNHMVPQNRFSLSFKLAVVALEPVYLIRALMFSCLVGFQSRFLFTLVGTVLTFEPVDFFRSAVVPLDVFR